MAKSLNSNNIYHFIIIIKFAAEQELIIITNGSIPWTRARPYTASQLPVGSLSLVTNYIIILNQKSAIKYFTLPTKYSKFSKRILALNNYNYKI